MNTLEDRLREVLAERATVSPIDPDAWDKTVARSRRRRRFRWQWPARTGLLVPAAAAAAVTVIAVAATLLTGHGGLSSAPGAKSTRSATPGASPSVPPPPGRNYLVLREIPPVTPFVRIKLFADGHTVWTYLWFGYVPGYASAGIALCEVNDGGAYDGYSACTSGRLAPGVLARSAATDGSGWIRLGVTAPQVASVTAVLPDRQTTVQGVVEPVRGLPYKLWAVSYPVGPAARLVFRDAAGREVTHLDVPGEQPAPSRPSHGGIALFRYGNAMMTAYRISGDRIGFWTGGDSMWSDVPISESALNAIATGSIRSSTGSTPDDWFGYAPSGVARVGLRLSDGRQFGSRTIPGWPGSGVVFWGPLTLPSKIAMPGDIIVITYDATGHVLHEVPLIFLG
jgi:hypothetical protein